MRSMRTRARLRGRGKSAPASGARTGRPLQSVDALPYNPAYVTYALAKCVLCLLRSAKSVVPISYGLSCSWLFVCWPDNALVWLCDVGTIACRMIARKVNFSRNQ